MASPKANGGKTQAWRGFETQQYATRRDDGTLAMDATMSAFPSMFSEQWQAHGRQGFLRVLAHAALRVVRCHLFHLGNGISSTLETRKTR